jgi:hypothetical protein
MASMGSEIIIRPELRPCEVKFRGEVKKALFHKWMTYAEIIKPSLMIEGDKGGQLQCDQAIVELENGLVTIILPWEVKFVDNAFCEFAWAWPEDDKNHSKEKEGD